MQYKYVLEQPDYSDYTSGRVFYSLPGHPAFPVRLASEVFQRCIALRQSLYQASEPCCLYDPCCGAAYHLSVLAFLHGEHLSKVFGSDVDEKAVALARRNLGLVSVAGLDARIGEISEFIERYQKDSHKEALASALVLRDRIAKVSPQHPLRVGAFQANATDAQAMLANLPPHSVDIVFTDVPYGQHSHWQTTEPGVSPLWAMLEALLQLLSPASVVAVASDKQQKVAHAGYQRVEHFQLGKRRVVLLKPI